MWNEAFRFDDCIALEGGRKETGLGMMFAFFMIAR